MHLYSKDLTRIQIGVCVYLYSWIGHLFFSYYSELASNGKLAFDVLPYVQPFFAVNGTESSLASLPQQLSSALFRASSFVCVGQS